MIDAFFFLKGFVPWEQREKKQMKAKGERQGCLHMCRLRFVKNRAPPLRKDVSFPDWKLEASI